MGCSRLLSFFFFGILIHLAKPTIVQRDPLVHYQCSTNGDVSINSTYRANLNSLLSSLSSNNQINNGFYNFSAGENSDKANVIALCRGDLTPTNCRSCVNLAAHELLIFCPNQKEGILWYTNCTVRYSNNSIFGVMEFEPVQPLNNPANVSDESGTFKQVRGTLLDSLRSKAASGDSLRKLATGTANSTYFSIYALLQCTPDLEEQECSNCLNKTIRYLPNCCDDAAGARVLTPSCNLRYEKNTFYDTTPDVVLPPSSSPPPPAEGKGSNSSGTTIIVVAAVAFVVLIICICVCVCIYLIVKKPRKKVETVDEIISAESLQFDFATIRVATENFLDANRLGQGGFGAVYKGMLSNGQEIAVKRLSSGSGQGDQEFKNEVLLLAKLQHRNLVRLLGFCLERNERILIYELMPNASLDHFIFDFGIARLFVQDQTHGNTRRIVGTYMAKLAGWHNIKSYRSHIES